MQIVLTPEQVESLRSGITIEVEGTWLRMRTETQRIEDEVALAGRRSLCGSDWSGLAAYDQMKNP